MTVAPMMEHFWESIPNYFWFQNAYDRLLSALPTDRPSTWVEVGCYQGGSLAWLGVEVLNRGLPVTIHAVDSFVGWEGMEHIADLRAVFERNIAPLRERLNGQLVIHPQQSLVVAPSFADESCDVVWIDADHSYKAVSADIDAWLPKVKPGGTLGGDDWAMVNVRQAVEDAFGSRVELVRGGKNGKWESWLLRKP